VTAQTRFDRALWAIEQVAGSARDERGLRLEVLQRIRRVVGFSSYAWLLTDPVTEVGSSPLADVPCLPELPRLIRLKYATPVNRWTSMPAGAQTLSAVTAGELGRSLLWREMLRGYDVQDMSSVVFRDRHGCWGFLDLWRSGTDGEFTHTEVGFLAEVARVVTDGLRRCQAATFESAVSTSRAPVVLVLAPDLTVRAQTEATEEYLRVLVPPDGDRRAVPAGAYNVAAQLCANEDGVDQHPPLARVHLSGGRWLTLSAARMDAGIGSDADIAVTIEVSSPGERAEVLARACGLTRRETELLGHLVTGGDTRTIAAQMFLSEHTVQDHLKAIFTKTHTRTRRTLVAHVVGL
jgi:DNA-binding NarL/FixJ family response regulator